MKFIVRPELLRNRVDLITLGITLVSLALMLAGALSHGLFWHGRLFGAPGVQAASQGTGSAVGERVPPSDGKHAAISIQYPEDGSIFPPEITPPTFLWRGGDESAKSWRIEITFLDGSEEIRADSLGESPQIGEIDPRCVSSNNQLPSLTVEDAKAHTWKPDQETWTRIKQHSTGHTATVVITGVNAAGRVVESGRVTLSTSKDAVGAPIFYRDVPLMPSAGEKNVIQPLSPSQLYLINWRIRDIGKTESRVVMHDQHTCANCHSFSADGKTMGMDVDGPDNDKGLYAVVPVAQRMSIRTQDMVAWNSDLRVGTSRVGFMSQVSPDGEYVLSTFAGKDQSIPNSYFMTNFNDYRFLQVFYPTRGILAFYGRATGRREPLLGASDTRYVQTDGVWSPDGKYVVFARAEAKDPYPQGQKASVAANDPNEPQIQYSLYRVPFNGGKGGVAKPIAGASNNGMSNNFPKVSPDGRWIVFVKNRNGQLMRPDSELYIVPAAGGVARKMRCNTSLMNSWHSFSPNGRWLVFSSKSRSPYTQMFLTHIDEQGNDSPAIYIENSTAANRAVNIPEFVNIRPNGLDGMDMPAADFYRVVDEALALQKKGDPASSLAKWARVLEMDPKDAMANNGMGIALGVSGRPEEAIAYFRNATAINGKFFEAYYNLGLLLDKEKRVSEAVDAWENTVRIRPEFARGHENLGFALYAQGKYSEALTHLRLAYAGEPNRVYALNLAATLLATCPDAALRNGAEALTLAERAEKMTGGRDPWVLDTVSAAFAETGAFGQAVETEKQALALAEQQGDAALEVTLEAHLAKYASHEALREPPDSGSF